MRSGGEKGTREWRILHADGSFGWYEFTLTDLQDHPAVRGTVGNFRDVTARHAADAALRESEKRFRRVVDHSSDAFLSLDSDDHITGWNPAAESMFGWTPAAGARARSGRPPRARGPVHGPRLLRAALARASEQAPRAVFEMNVVGAGGRQFPVEVSVVQDSTVGSSQFQAFFRDITARKAEEARLTRQALTDPLTGLANRFSSATGSRGRSPGWHAGKAPSLVMFLDVDRFKLVNDGLGHEAGDKLLKAIGAAHRAHHSGDRHCGPLRRRRIRGRGGGHESARTSRRTIAERIIAAVGDPLAARRPRAQAEHQRRDRLDRLGAIASADDLAARCRCRHVQGEGARRGRLCPLRRAMGVQARSRLELEEDLRVGRSTAASFGSTTSRS